MHGWLRWIASVRPSIELQHISRSVSEPQLTRAPNRARAREMFNASSWRGGHAACSESFVAKRATHSLGMHVLPFVKRLVDAIQGFPSRSIDAQQRSLSSISPQLIEALTRPARSRSAGSATLVGIRPVCSRTPTAQLPAVVRVQFNASQYFVPAITLFLLEIADTVADELVRPHVGQTRAVGTNVASLAPAREGGNKRVSGNGINSRCNYIVRDRPNRT